MSGISRPGRPRPTTRSLPIRRTASPATGCTTPRSRGRAAACSPWPGRNPTRFVAAVTPTSRPRARAAWNHPLGVSVAEDESPWRARLVKSGGLLRTGGPDHLPLLPPLPRRPDRHAAAGDDPGGPVPLLPPGAELARPRECRPRGPPHLGEAAAGAHRRVVHHGRRDDGPRRGAHLRDLPPGPPGTPRDPGLVIPRESYSCLLCHTREASIASTSHSTARAPRAAKDAAASAACAAAVTGSTGGGSRSGRPPREGRRSSDSAPSTAPGRPVPPWRRDEPPAGGGAAPRSGDFGVAAVLERRPALSSGGDHLRHLPRCPSRRAGRSLSAREPRGRRGRPVRRLPRRTRPWSRNPARSGEDPGDDLRALPQRARSLWRSRAGRRRAAAAIAPPPISGTIAAPATARGERRGAVIAERFHPASPWQG